MVLGLVILMISRALLGITGDICEANEGPCLGLAQLLSLESWLCPDLNLAFIS